MRLRLVPALLLVCVFSWALPASAGDFDGNGSVSDADLSLLLGNWTGVSGAVLEPATIALLGVGAVGLLRRRSASGRRRPL